MSRRTQVSTTDHPVTGHQAAERAHRRALSEALWAMTPAERQAAMWAGELTHDQLWEWCKRAPGEVPLIHNEFAFIAAFTPEVAEAGEIER
jgi:hypothetical protein